MLILTFSPLEVKVPVESNVPTLVVVIMSSLAHSGRLAGWPHLPEPFLPQALRGGTPVASGGNKKQLDNPIKILPTLLFYPQKILKALGLTHTKL